MVSKSPKVGSAVFFNSSKDDTFDEIAEMLEDCGVRSYEIETWAVGSGIAGVVSLPIGCEDEAALIVLMHEGATVRLYR